MSLDTYRTWTVRKLHTINRVTHLFIQTLLGSGYRKRDEDETVLPPFYRARDPETKAPFQQIETVPISVRKIIDIDTSGIVSFDTFLENPGLERAVLPLGVHTHFLLLRCRRVFQVEAVPLISETGVGEAFLAVV